MSDKSLRTLLYLRWWAMIDRCTNANNLCYSRYGGRGIAVCDRWRQSFDAFIHDMGPIPSLDYSIERIDNLGPYSPENCRWATLIEQGANKRNNHLLTFQGRTQPLNVWARELGIPRTRIAVRLGRGWPVERALSHQPYQRRPEYQAGQPAVRRKRTPAAETPPT